MRNFGTTHLRRYHDELFETIGLIARQPKLARERLEIRPPVRVQPFKAYLIVYSVCEGGIVFVIRATVMKIGVAATTKSAVPRVHVAITRWLWLNFVVSDSLWTAESLLSACLPEIFAG